MYPQIYSSPREFHLVYEWKRFLVIIPLITSVLLLIIIFVAELTLWTSHWFSSLVNLLLGLGVYLIYLFIGYFFLYVLTKPIRHIVTSEGITFCSAMYRIYTPWKNIRGVGTSRLGIYRPQALLLQEPAVKGSVRDGDTLERATIERRWGLTTKKDAPDDAIPLLFTVPANWRESDLGGLIRQYAPQAFH